MSRQYTAEITDPITGHTVTARAETPKDLELAIDQYLATSYPVPDADGDDTARTQPQDQR